MSLTACLIVKDEGSVLSRCLDSLVGAVDAIVVVDTGSRDDSRDLARQAGARVIEFPWNDDFSAARNAGLELVRTDWVLTIDADEWFASAEDALALRSSLPDRPAGGRVKLVNHLDGDRRQRVGLLRVFPNDPAVRYEGRIHEQVTRSIALKGWPILDLSGVLQHDGYRNQVLAKHDKLTRNRTLLEATLRARPDDLEAWFHLGKTLNLMNRPEEAERAFEMVTSSSHAEEQPHLVSRAWTFRAELAQRLRGATAGRAILESCGPRETWPSRLALLATRWHLEAREFGAAGALARYVMTLDDERFDDPWDRPELRKEARRLLARALHGQGKPNEAWDLIADLIPDPGEDDATAWLLRGALALSAGRRDQALDAYGHVLMRMPDHIPSWIALGTLLIELGRSTEACERLSEARSRVGNHPELDLLLSLASRLR